MNKFLKTSIIFLLYIVGLNQANAATKYYAGLDISAQNIGAEANDRNVDYTSKTLHVQDFYNTMTSGPSIFAGVDIDNYNLKIETFYSHFTDQEKTTNGTVTYRAIPLKTVTSITTDVVGLDFKPYVKFTENFSGSLIAGLNYYKIRIKENASTQYGALDDSQTISKFAPSIGFGLEYAFNEKITGRAQYKRSFLKANLDQEKSIFLTKIKDVDTFNIGLAYNF